MNVDKAYTIIRQLGTIFANALKERGHEVAGTSILMHGIGAYIKLELEGQDVELDEAYQVVMHDMMEAVRGKWKAA